MTACKGEEHGHRSQSSSPGHLELYSCLTGVGGTQKLYTSRDSRKQFCLAHYTLSLLDAVVWGWNQQKAVRRCSTKGTAQPRVLYMAHVSKEWDQEVWIFACVTTWIEISITGQYYLKPGRALRHRWRAWKTDRQY